MVTVRTWLLVAAERREFDGIRKRMGSAKQLVWPGANFACEAQWQGDRWWMLANGPGEALVLEGLKEKKTWRNESTDYAGRSIRRRV
jgi:hypothetical protein